jgi:hypothetical protein
MDCLTTDCARKLAQGGGRYETDEQAQDGNDDENFQQGETLTTR